MEHKNIIDMIFRDAVSESRLVSISYMEHERMRTLRYASAEDAFASAMAHSETSDVYFGMGLIPPGVAGRGKSTDIACIGALWADIDCRAPHRDRADLPTKDEAIELIADMPLRTSVVIDSGYGFHAYWMLKEPWMLETDSERSTAAAMARGWHGLLCAKASARGWRMENLGDLARVMRVNGTLNHKGTHPVNVGIAHISDAQYVQDDFDDYYTMDDEEATAVHVAFTSTTQLDQALFDVAYANSPKFRGTWDATRDDLNDHSQSAADLSLATCAAKIGWPEQQIANLIVAAREKAGSPAKARRIGYLRLTVAKALAAARADELAGGYLEHDDYSYADSPPSMPLEQQSVIWVTEHDDVTETADPGPIPPELMAVPGFVSDYMQWVTSSVARPCPVAAFGGALAMLSHITGRKIRTPGDARSNFYFIVIGDTGIGKDGPRKANRNIMTQSQMFDEYAEDIRTAEGLEDALAAHPALMWQPDEFDVIMRNMSRDDSNSGGRWEEFSRKLRSVYTTSDSDMKCRIRARSKHLEGEVPTIRQPHLTMYASATPKAFISSISQDQVLDGLLSRCIILQVPYVLIDQRQKSLSDIPQHILDHAKAWHEWYPDGNLQAEIPHPLIVPISNAAQEILDAFRASCTKRQADETCSPIERAMLSRAALHAEKAALLHAASTTRPQHQALSIDVAQATWGIEFIKAIGERTTYTLHTTLGDTLFGKVQLKIIDILKRSGGAISLRDLQRRMRGEMLLDKALKALQIQERIQDCQVLGKKKMRKGIMLV